MNEALNKATTLVEFIDTLASYYDLQGNKPSKMILVMIATAIKTAVGIENRDIVEASLKSVTLYDFLMTFAQYYDSVNKVLDIKHKQLMLTKITGVMNMTRCKKIQ